MSRRYTHDVLVLGSGAAGLATALGLAPHGRVAILSKGVLPAGSTLWAQGGIAAVLDDADHLDAHVRDTLEAGAGLCHEAAVRYTVERGPEAVRWLVDQGVGFDMETGVDGAQRFHLTQEGGHSHRRIIHAADATGSAVETTLVDRVQQSPNVEVFEHHVAVDLLIREKLGLPGSGCIGAYVLDNTTGAVDVFSARYVVLATGGASKVYLYTSNPDGSTGDGIAMAWRAGCRVTNMEFNQFHPTCLYHPEAKSFLVSEALRGEGGVLRLPDGERFMDRFDPRAELAPRDIVARAIDHEMKRLGADCLYLDVSHLDAAKVESHFPNIRRRCLDFGIDITKEPIPVVPAAHYTCGGVVTDLRGRTDVPGLYAVGECASTGLHGANRMASNSLLECIVFARAASQDIAALLDTTPEPPQAPLWDESQVTDSDEDVVISHNWDELRRFMWDYVGIVRTDKRLARARHRITTLRSEIHEYYSNYKISADLVELRNLAQVADLIIQSAQSRRESRGLHYTLDFPQASAAPRDTMLTPSPLRLDINAGREWRLGGFDRRD
ncbi:MAG TPA: L-aspartate oxidase [Pseudomonadales bacterium]|nr:L-aspartate oxidase [Pseudomonadales bacterium]